MVTCGVLCLNYVAWKIFRLYINLTSRCMYVVAIRADNKLFYFRAVEKEFDNQIFLSLDRSVLLHT